MAAVLLCFGAFMLEGADVQCIWNGSTYVCSGTGSSIEVIGGGSGLPVTVTNVWGVCTNCVKMTPEYCEDLKMNLKMDASSLADAFEVSAVDAGQVLSLVEDIDSDISTFRRFSNLPRTPLPDAAELVAFSNYVETAGNTQALLVRESSGYNSPILQVRYRAVSYSNGVYDYAQSLISSLSSQRRYLEALVDELSVGKDRARALSSAIDTRLICEQCQAGDGRDPPGGGGSGVATNGNWCTFDQGEAIKDLLRDMKAWAERQHSQLVAISNSVAQSYQTLKDGLFTVYTHVPTEEELGMHWQELYLSGYSPNFHEYAATNILARIELLLAGMSGVLTNSSDFAAAGSFAESDMVFTNQVKVAVDDFTNNFVNVIQQREANVRSVGDALVGLYNAFRGWSGTPFSRTTLVNSYSIEIGDRHWDVPGFEPSEEGLQVANLIRVVCRSVMSVIYILFTVAVFVRFHIAFFQWVWKYVKWGVELMQGLFA